eukprot:12965129-Ditylum_brightwellii.AAC.1
MGELSEEKKKAEESAAREQYQTDELVEEKKKVEERSARGKSLSEEVNTTMDELLELEKKAEE